MEKQTARPGNKGCCKESERKKLGISMTYDEENGVYYKLSNHKRVCRYGRDVVDMYTSEREIIDEKFFQLTVTCKCGHLMQFKLHRDDYNILFNTYDQH